MMHRAWRGVLAVALSILTSAFGLFPAGAPPIAVPSEASGAGFNTLVFNQDANNGFDFDCTGALTSLHSWYGGLGASSWSGYIAPPTTCGNISYTGGELLIKIPTTSNVTCPSNCPPLIATENNNLTAGREFGHAYIEWVGRMDSYNGSTLIGGAPSGSVLAFWMIGATTISGCNANAANVEYSELDNIEAYNSFSGNGKETYFYQPAASGGCQASLSNASHILAALPDYTQFHKFGLLWVNGTLTWYLDDVQQFTNATTAETENQLHILMASLNTYCTGFGLTSCLAAGTTEIDLHIQSIRVWSCTNPNQLAC